MKTIKKRKKKNPNKSLKGYLKNFKNGDYKTYEELRNNEKEALYVCARNMDLEKDHIISDGKIENEYVELNVVYLSPNFEKSISSLLKTNYIVGLIKKHVDGTIELHFADNLIHKEVYDRKKKYDEFLYWYFIKRITDDLDGLPMSYDIK